MELERFIKIDWWTFELSIARFLGNLEKRYSIIATAQPMKQHHFKVQQHHRPQNNSAALHSQSLFPSRAFYPQFQLNFHRKHANRCCNPSKYISQSNEQPSSLFLDIVESHRISSAKLIQSPFSPEQMLPFEFNIHHKNAFSLLCATQCLLLFDNWA